MRLKEHEHGRLQVVERYAASPRRSCRLETDDRRAADDAAAARSRTGGRAGTPGPVAAPSVRPACRAGQPRSVAAVRRPDAVGASAATRSRAELVLRRPARSRPTPAAAGLAAHPRDP